MSQFIAGPAFFCVAAGLPLRVSREHREAERVAVIVAGRAYGGRDVHGGVGGLVSYRRHVLERPALHLGELDPGLGIGTVEGHLANRVAVIAGDALPAHLAAQAEIGDPEGDRRVALQADFAGVGAEVGFGQLERVLEQASK